MSSSSSPTPPQQQNPQIIQQFLSSVLSQRGPSSLPYTEDVKWLIRQHLLSLINSYPSLQPKTATFTHNDGRAVNLLQADGTVPMTYQNATYNIPVLIWLIETYPRHAPCVYVNPTPDMIIKRPHPYVNPSGLVSIAYLQNWIYPSSSLIDLARNLSVAFGQDPPLYSRSPRPNPNPNPNPGSNYEMNQASIRPAIPPRIIPTPSPYGSNAGSRLTHQPSQQQQSIQRIEDPAEVFRRNAINKLVETAHGDIIALRKTRETEMEVLFNTQAVLRQREEHLLKGVREMNGEKESLEQQLQMVLMNTDVTEAWLRDNEAKLRNLGVVDVDDAFEATDPLSKQILDCTSSDLAIEDVIYALDKAVQEGAIPFDQYLRNVRLLSRQQFFHRATVAKINAASVQTQVANMSARISNYVAS